MDLYHTGWEGSIGRVVTRNNEFVVHCCETSISCKRRALQIVLTVTKFKRLKSLLLVAAREGSRYDEVYNPGRPDCVAFPLFFSVVLRMKSMLVIDASACVARLFAEIFEKRGWRVVTCCERDSTIELLAGHKAYNAILLSYHVPGTTGVQLVRFIRSLPHRRMAAVIMLTGSDEVTDEALSAGADEVLLRPINPNALLWVVNKLVT